MDGCFLFWEGIISVKESGSGVSIWIFTSPASENERILLILLDRSLPGALPSASLPFFPRGMFECITVSYQSCTGMYDFFHLQHFCIDLEYSTGLECFKNNKNETYGVCIYLWISIVVAGDTSRDNRFCIYSSHISRLIIRIVCV